MSSFSLVSFSSFSCFFSPDSSSVISSVTTLYFSFSLSQYFSPLCCVLGNCFYSSSILSFLSHEVFTTSNALFTAVGFHFFLHYCFYYPLLNQMLHVSLFFILFIFYVFFFCFFFNFYLRFLYYRPFLQWNIFPIFEFYVILIFMFNYLFIFVLFW